ncbi:MAG TPA: tetraacyldisaccharide 4'-kinase [Magnetococcales bacterium]|nr:tetraacyldisaccharide 4'-kinase [Magnetococcales bacterium]
MRRLLPLLEGHRKPAGWMEQGGLKILGTVGRGYGLIQAGRAKAYQQGLLTQWHADCPVISVGNLTAGGTGKTPMVAWLGRFFLDRGIPLAIVSRGYRQQSRAPITLVSDGKGHILRAPEAADEAVLLAHELADAVVLTGPKRRHLIHYATRHMGCRLILMDDGFQHLQVYRDLDLLLLDAQHPWGNGHILPGGTLRESCHALGRAHAVIFTRAEIGADLTMATAVIHRHAPGMPVAPCHHQPKYWINATDSSTLPLSAMQHQKTLAFCGIAHPESFRTTLEHLLLKPVDLKIFPDHHVYTPSQMEQLETLARTLRATALVTTQKDSVKIPHNATTLPLFVLAIGIHFPYFPPWLEACLDSIATKAK